MLIFLLPIFCRHFVHVFALLLSHLYRSGVSCVCVYILLLQVTCSCCSVNFISDNACLLKNGCKLKCFIHNTGALSGHRYTMGRGGIKSNYSEPSRKAQPESDLQHSYSAAAMLPSIRESCHYSPAAPSSDPIIPTVNCTYDDTPTVSITTTTITTTTTIFFLIWP